MTFYKILAKIARYDFIKKVMKYKLGLFKSDTILDYGDHSLVVLKNMPGILFFKMETTVGVPTHYEVYLRSEGEVHLLGTYCFNHQFPMSNPSLKLVGKNE